VTFLKQRQRLIAAMKSKPYVYQTAHDKQKPGIKTGNEPHGPKYRLTSFLAGKKNPPEGGFFLQQEMTQRLMVSFSLMRADLPVRSRR